MLFVFAIYALLTPRKILAWFYSYKRDTLSLSYQFQIKYTCWYYQFYCKLRTFSKKNLIIYWIENWFTTNLHCNWILKASYIKVTSLIAGYFLTASDNKLNTRAYSISLYFFRLYANKIHVNTTRARKI